MQADRVNVLNVLRIVTEIKNNPHQTDHDIYSFIGISRAAFYKYRKYLADKLDFRFSYSRKEKKFIIEEENTSMLLPSLNLTLAEISSLVFSTGQIWASGGDFHIGYSALQAIKKIIGQAKPKVRSKLSTLLEDTLDNRGYGCKPDILNILEEAMENTKIVKILYYSPHEKKEEDYDVDPYTIYFKRRALYMDAYSRTHDQVRMFRIARIKKAKILPPPNDFYIRPDYSFKKQHANDFSVFGGEVAQRVKIRFSPRVAEMVQEVLWHRSQKITADPTYPGYIIFEVKVGYPKEVIWWMRQWAADAEVLEPEDMREYARDMARHELALYENPAV